MIASSGFIKQLGQLLIQVNWRFRQNCPDSLILNKNNVLTMLNTQIRPQMVEFAGYLYPKGIIGYFPIYGKFNAFQTCRNTNGIDGNPVFAPALQYVVKSR